MLVEQGHAGTHHRPALGGQGSCEDARLRDGFHFAGNSLQGPIRIIGLLWR